MEIYLIGCLAAAIVAVIYIRNLVVHQGIIKLGDILFSLLLVILSWATLSVVILMVGFWLIDGGYNTTIWKRK